MTSFIKRLVECHEADEARRVEALPPATSTDRYALPCIHCGKTLHGFHGPFARCEGGATQFTTEIDPPVDAEGVMAEHRCPRCDRDLVRTPSGTYIECSCEPVDDLAPLREQKRSRVDVAISALIDAGTALGLAHGHVMALEDERPLIKARCIEAMIGTPNPLGKEGARHSASSAEAVVDQHADYWQHRQKQIAAEIHKHESAAAYEAAKLRARLLVNFASAGGE